MYEYMEVGHHRGMIANYHIGTPFEAMTGRTAPSSDGLLAEVIWGSPQL